MRALRLALALSIATSPLLADSSGITCSVPTSAVGPALNYTPSATVQQLADTANGQIQPINGKIVVLFVGMSHYKDQDTRILSIAGTKNSKFLPDGGRGWKEYLNPAIVLFNCAQSGMTIGYWDEPTDAKWPECGTKLAAAGLSWSQVQVLHAGLVEKNSLDPLTGATFTEAQARGVISSALAHAPNLTLAIIAPLSTSLYCTPREDANGVPLTWAQMDQNCKVHEPGPRNDSILLVDMVEAGGFPITSVMFEENWTRGNLVNPKTEARTPSGYLLGPAFGVDCPVDLELDGLHNSPTGQWEIARSRLGRMLIQYEFMRRSAPVPLP